MSPPDGLIAFRIADGLIAVNRHDGLIDVKYRFEAPTLDSRYDFAVAVSQHHKELDQIKPRPQPDSPCTPNPAPVSPLSRRRSFTS
jgi:hypothetical protein